MSKGISLTFSIPTRHANKKLAQTRLQHRHNTYNLRLHSNNIPVLVRNMIMDDFNTSTTQVYRTRHMLTGHSKWDAPKPLDTEDYTEIFGPDVRPRPAGKTRRAKKTKSETTGSSGGSASGSLSDYVSEDLRRKLQAGISAYEAKKAKEMAMIEFKEIEFLTIDADSLPKPKASIIRNRQEKIIAKYTQLMVEPPVLANISDVLVRVMDIAFARLKDGHICSNELDEKAQRAHMFLRSESSNVQQVIYPHVHSPEIRITWLTVNKKANVHYLPFLTGVKVSNDQGNVFKASLIILKKSVFVVCDMKSPSSSSNVVVTDVKCELRWVSNGGRNSLYIDHYDEDLTDFIKEDNLIDLIVDVDTATIGDTGNEIIKAQKNQNPKAGQTSMARDGSVFRYDLDYLREQFMGLVIQRALPFNHFDHEQTMREFQNTMQPRYTNVSRSTLKRHAMRLWLAAKQEIIDSFGNLNACVNLTTDVWSARHGVPGSYMCVTVHWIEPGTWQMMKRGISFEEFSSPHTGHALFKMLIKVLTNFNLKDKDVFGDEVQRNESISLSDEEIALDASSESTLYPGGPRYDYMMSSEAKDDY
nr:zinc finger BED domain-containing protein RICESLEEPER 2-like [Tanacetum cinerariifolium]